MGRPVLVVRRNLPPGSRRRIRLNVDFLMARFVGYICEPVTIGRNRSCAFVEGRIEQRAGLRRFIRVDEFMSNRFFASNTPNNRVLSRNQWDAYLFTLERSNGFSSPRPPASFMNNCWNPSRADEYTIRFPSGLQIGLRSNPA